MISRATVVSEEYLVHACNGQRRFVRAPDPYAAMMKVAASLITQDEASFPGWRDMIDTIAWGEVR
jgi:hypothetical protein